MLMEQVRRASIAINNGNDLFYDRASIFNSLDGLHGGFPRGYDVIDNHNPRSRRQITLNYLARAMYFGNIPNEEPLDIFVVVVTAHNGARYHRNRTNGQPPHRIDIESIDQLIQHLADEESTCGMQFHHLAIDVEFTSLSRGQNDIALQKRPVMQKPQQLSTLLILHCLAPCVRAACSKRLPRWEHDELCQIERKDTRYERKILKWASPLRLGSFS